MLEPLHHGAVLGAQREDFVVPTHGALKVHKDHRAVLQRRLHRIARDFDDSAALRIQAVPSQPVVAKGEAAQHALVIGVGSGARRDSRPLGEQHGPELVAVAGGERPGVFELAHLGPLLGQLGGERGGGLGVVREARQVVQRDTKFPSGFRDGPDLALTPSGDRLRDPWTCRCGVLSDWTVERCPACGADRPVPQPLDARRAGAGNGSGIDVIDGETEEVDGVGRLAGDWREDRATAWRQLCAIAAARQQAKGAWDATKAKKFALAQYKQLYGDWPRGETRFETAATIDPAAHRWVTSRLIAYWKAKSRERVA